MTREAAVALAVLHLAACASRVEATPETRPPRTLESHVERRDKLSLPGSLRRQIAGFRAIQVVARAEDSDVARVIASYREETRRVHPKVGPDFSVSETQRQRVARRDVQCVSRDAPGEAFRGTVSQVSRDLDRERWARVVVTVDNSRGFLLPGMEVALAIDAERKPVVVMGEVVAPDPECQSTEGRMWVDPAYAALVH